MKFDDWGSFVRLGEFLRTGNVNADADVKNQIEEYVKAEKDELRKHVHEKAMKIFGPVGLLSLCDVSGLCEASDVLMAAVHVQLLEASKSLGAELHCTGDDAEGFNADAKWPELFPDKWISKNPKGYSLRYKIAKIDEASGFKGIGTWKEAIVIVKAVLMGPSMLLISILDSTATSDSPATAGLKVGDYVTDGVSGRVNNPSTGVSGLITRASMLQLRDVVSDQLLEPILKPYVSRPSTSASGAGVSARHPPGGDTGPYYPYQDGGGGVPLRGGNIPAPRLGGYGQSDLYPGGGFGQGGMLFGPGNPEFDRRAGGFNPRFDGIPGSVPPGARFDPYTPPGVIPPQPGRPPRGARFPGEPNPDHLRPPGGFGDGFGGGFGGGFM
eukprot:CAMPEP_0203798352 /NCGR_PEP_ID=MMETSP0100_2-20121128/9204_1 /ASSEMBLY_ACC=CAM_ASM_000210 /TAXON_ID=96639 /ORGANISM=" , Strain NY0313808BC1" /LENGTH=382 /DNA_ID=CAMNT_0050703895 /DNA_START=34 /DNA_END=1182 /DNA_ORIENTATION=-